jgi:hypothetical protein
MAVETFGVDAQLVIDELPINTRGITSSSEGLNTTKICEWIDEAAAMVAALCVRAGISVEQLAADTDQGRYVARSAILAFAVAKSLEASTTNPDDPRIDRAWTRWREYRAILKDSPGEVGQAQQATSQIHTNVDLNKTRPRRSFSRTRW